MKTPEREVFPEVLAPGDPCSGDEALFEPGNYANFLLYGGEGVDPSAWAALEAAFHLRVLAVLEGSAAWDDPALLHLAAALKVDHVSHGDTRPRRTAERPVPDTVLSDVVEDLLPDWGVLTERVTGDDRRGTPAILAVLFFVPVSEDGRRPLDRWAGDEEDRALVQAAKVIDGSPPGLFQDGVPLLPTGPERIPAGAAPPGVYVGRPYLNSDGWAWSGCVKLPAIPALYPLERRLRLELWRHRLTERRASWEDMLRARPQVLYRAACEGAEHAVSAACRDGAA